MNPLVLRWQVIEYRQRAKELGLALGAKTSRRMPLTPVCQLPCIGYERTV